MANLFGRLGGGRRAGSVKQRSVKGLPPTPDGPLLSMYGLGDDAAERGVFFDAEGDWDANAAEAAQRQAVQDALSDGSWRKALGVSPSGTIGQAPVIGDVLKRRYYGDDFEKIVAAADAAAMQQRPSHYSPRRDRLPSDAVSDRVLMVRSHEGDAAAMPNGGVLSSVDSLEQMTNNIPNWEDAHRGAESHELGHYLDLSNGFETKPAFNSQQAREIRKSLMQRLGDEDAVQRVMYAAQGPTRSPGSSELIANIASHKRNHYAINGDVPTTRDGVRAMFEEMAQGARDFDVRRPDFYAYANERSVDPSGVNWDAYGPDPEAAFGPSKGRSLRGATEAKMNLGNIFLEADPKTQDKMIEDFLRSVDNNDIRKSLLARTA